MSEIKKKTTIIIVSVVVTVVVVTVSLTVGLVYGLKPKENAQLSKFEIYRSLTTKPTKATLVYFYSMGHPFDNARNLVQDAKVFDKLFKPHISKISAYNSHMLKKLDAKLFHQVFFTLPIPFIAPEHYRGNGHGFWGWKSWIIHLELQKMKNGEILFYHDMQVSKYLKTFAAFEKPLEPFLLFLLEEVKADIFVPYEHPNDLLRLHTKKLIIDELGSFVPAYTDWHQLNANRIIIRKTDYTVGLVKSWFDACLRRELISPETEHEQGLHCSTHDQAILMVLCRKEILSGKLPFDWPRFWFQDKVFNVDHLKVLDTHNK